MLPNCWSGRPPQALSEIDRDILDVGNFPPEDPWIYSGRYLQAREQQLGRAEAQTPPEAIANFHEEAIARLRKLAAHDPELDEVGAVTGFERLWPQLSEQLKESWFYTWLADFAMDSSFLYTYFVELSGKAPALELANGYSWDITGRYRKIPPCDTAYYFRVAEPTFRSFTQRIWFSQQKGLLAVAKELGWRPQMLRDDWQRPLPRRPKVLFLGGGLTPQLRSYELTPELAARMFDITVYDNDPNLPQYLQAIYGRSLEDYGINCCQEDFRNAFKDESLWGEVDALLMTGVMSYYNTPEQISEILDGVEKLLRPGGKFVFDRQVFEASMKRCVFILAWRGTTMKPDFSAKQAIDAVQEMIAGRSLNDLYYEVDHYNQEAAIVNFALTKAE